MNGSPLLFLFCHVFGFNRLLSSNKLINIPGPKYKSGDERMVAACVVPEDGDLQVYTASRMMTIKWDDLDDYYGDRALRGSLLPKGWRKVERLAGVD